MFHDAERFRTLGSRVVAVRSTNVGIRYESAEIPGLSVRQMRYPPGYRQEAHAHEQSTVSVVLAGTIREDAGGEAHVAGATSVVVKPAGTVHQDRFAEMGASLLQVRLPYGVNGVDGETLSDGARLPRYGWRHGGAASAARARRWRELSLPPPWRGWVRERRVA